MPLVAGTRLGLYEVVSALGAGGMGEVYRARDTKLGRDVAVKALPEAFAFDADRVARFEREAKVLASLNHPHIAALYGMEQSVPSTTPTLREPQGRPEASTPLSPALSASKGEQGRGTTSSEQAGSEQAVHFLVMELVEGETLAERLRRGALPVDEALKVAHQIAEALDAAHEKGVVHRDLKPANVKITPDEKIKVLDFGLARAMEPSGAMQTPASLTHSPTLSIMATQAGIILGTAAYMSPEQAQGLQVDSRTDVFSFGSVLYEMLTGRQAFQGDTAAAVMASVLVREPDLTALPPNLNPRLVELLKRCLEKNPKRRWQAVGDLRVEIEAVAAAPRTAPAPQTTVVVRPPIWQRIATHIGTLLAGGVLAGAAVWFVTRPAAPRVVRWTMTSPAAAALAVNGNDRDLAITPDGTRIIYVGGTAAQRQLFVRALDELEPTPLAGLGQPRGVFLAPDGQWIGFVDGLTVLKKVAITGGPAVTLVPRMDAGSRGAAWGADGTIIFATASTTTGLQRVSAAGGEAIVLTRPSRERGESDHLWPEFLPGGQAVLFTITPATGPIDNAQVAVLDLRTGVQKVLVRGGSRAHYVPSGHLVYAAAGTLRAVTFDLERLEAGTTPTPVLPQVVTTPNGGADFDVAADGTIVYVAGSAVQAAARTLVWVDRQGHEDPIKVPPRGYAYPRLSPDGTRVALDIRDQENDVWIWDFRRETLTRLTFDPGLDRVPIWMPDGRRVVFSSERSGTNLFTQAADGTGPVEQLTQSPNVLFPTAVSPDGTRAVFTDATAGANDVMMLTLDKDHRVQPLVQTPFVERNGEISSDGRWLAYEANDSGRSEIYVRPFPDVNSGHWQVSTNGGTRTAWAPSGEELFYFAPTGALMSVRVERGTAWKPGTPTKVFEGPYFTGSAGFNYRTYDVSPDGKRFLMIKAVGGQDQPATPPSLVVVENWVEELKRLVPTK